MHIRSTSSIAASGFTLVELLVVISIIGILVATLLPAVQSTRAVARKSSCSNNLKQVGLAVLAHESAQRIFPSGYDSYHDYGNITELSGEDYDAVTWDAKPGWGWGTQILPYLEQGHLFDELDTINRSVWNPQNATAVRTSLSVFLCPSASGGRDAFPVVDDSGATIVKAGGEVWLGRSHYVASHGQEECWSECSGPSGTVNGSVAKIADGPFYRNSRVRMRDIKDGPSSTVFLGEHTSKLSDKTWVGVVPGAMVGPNISSPDNGAESAATLVLVHSGPAGGEVDALGNPIIHPPNFPTLHVGQMMSEHPGGAHIVTGDGGVRFISEQFQLEAFSAMSSISEGDSISEK